MVFVGYIIMIKHSSLRPDFRSINQMQSFHTIVNVRFWPNTYMNMVNFLDYTQFTMRMIKKSEGFLKKDLYNVLSLPSIGTNDWNSFAYRDCFYF